MKPSPRLIALLVVGALVAVLVVAFATRGGNESDAIGGRYGSIVREAIPKVEAAVGLPFKRPPAFEVRSRDDVRRYIDQQLADSLAGAQIAGQEAALKQLGLIPDTLALETLLRDLLGEQIAGIYDPRANALYIVDGVGEEFLAIAVTHELVHALQDQYVDLDSVMRAVGNDDRQVAAQAMIEGQATFEQTRIMLGAELAGAPGGWDRAREVIRTQRAQWPVFANAPLVIQESLLFPYLSGAEFMRAVRAENPQASPLTDMPSSTEQILHPLSHYARARDTATTVALPALRGMTVIYENTLGEFTTRLFLYEHLRDQQGAIAGAVGWDGDRFAVVRSPRGEGIVWVSVWDSMTDGAEFYTLLDRTTDRRYGPSSARALTPERMGGGMTAGRSYAVGGRSIAVITGEIRGRPVVVYVNLPAGDDPLALDLAGIRIQ